MYAKPPDPAELAALGLRPEDMVAEALTVWPENMAVVMLFASLSTQWRTGAGGPVGLDYNVLYHKLDRLHLSDEAYADMESDIRAMELEALRIMNLKD